MKWMQKFSTCSLLASVTILICSSCKKLPLLTLLTHKSLNFPSASAIAFHNNRLYVLGDNAPYLLMLSADYTELGRIPYWHGTDTIIPKNEKPDIESAVVLDKDGEAVLAGIGSMSSPQRWSVVEFNLNHASVTISRYFNQQTTFNGVEEINIEGAASVGETMVFANRANLKTKNNHLIFWNRKDKALAKEIVLPVTTGIAGVSGLHYIPEKDLLLFTASEENTENALDDGEIGTSYLGWIEDFSKKTGRAGLTADGFLDLPATDKRFLHQKIESVCLEKISGNVLRLHLSADNDNGRSELFTVDLRL